MFSGSECLRPALRINQKVTKYGLHKALSLSLGVETVKSNLEELILGTQICDSNPRYTVLYLVLCKKQARILCSLRFASDCE